MPGESLGREGAACGSLIQSSSLTFSSASWKGQPSLILVSLPQIRDGSGHWGTRARQPSTCWVSQGQSGAQWQLGALAVGFGTTAVGLTHGHAVPWLESSRQPCSPRGAPGVGTQLPQGSQEHPSAGSVSPVHGGGRTCPHHGVAELDLQGRGFAHATLETLELQQCPDGDVAQADGSSGSKHLLHETSK